MRTDDEFDEVLAEMLVLQARAAEIVDGALSDEEWEAEPPDDELRRAVADLVDGVSRQRRAFRAVRGGAGWDAGLPEIDDPAALWLHAVAATIAPVADPGTPLAEQEALAGIDYGDWVGIVLGAHRSGAGTPVTAPVVLEWIEGCPELEVDLDDAARDDISRGVTFLLPPWRALHVVDDRDALTALGTWGLPFALMVAFDVDLGDEDAEAAAARE